jgi:hypothetical protein
VAAPCNLLAGVKLLDLAATCQLTDRLRTNWQRWHQCILAPLVSECSGLASAPGGRLASRWIVESRVHPAEEDQLINPVLVGNLNVALVHPPAIDTRFYR